MVNINNKARTTTSKQYQHQTNRSIKATTILSKQEHGRQNNNNKATIIIWNKNNGNMNDNDETTLTTPITTIIKNKLTRTRDGTTSIAKQQSTLI